jgi:hypothetical protein
MLGIETESLPIRQCLLRARKGALEDEFADRTPGVGQTGRGSRLPDASDM